MASQRLLAALLLVLLLGACGDDAPAPAPEAGQKDVAVEPPKPAPEPAAPEEATRLDRALARLEGRTYDRAVHILGSAGIDRHRLLDLLMDRVLNASMTKEEARPVNLALAVLGAQRAEALLDALEDAETGEQRGQRWLALRAVFDGPEAFKDPKRKTFLRRHRTDRHDWGDLPRRLMKIALADRPELDDVSRDLIGRLPYGVRRRAWLPRELLRRGLGDTSADIRYAAVVGLEDLGAEVNEVAEALLLEVYTHDTDGEVRLAAGRALTTIHLEKERARRAGDEDWEPPQVWCPGASGPGGLRRPGPELGGPIVLPPPKEDPPPAGGDKDK